MTDSQPTNPDDTKTLATLDSRLDPCGGGGSVYTRRAEWIAARLVGIIDSPERYSGAQVSALRLLAEIAGVAAREGTPAAGGAKEIVIRIEREKDWRGGS